MFLVFALPAGEAVAQDPNELTVNIQNLYIVDAYGKPWSDLACQIRVKLDPDYTKDLPSQELSVEKPAASFNGGAWKYYRLEKDERGSYARVPWIVFKNNNNPVHYMYEVFNPATKNTVPFLKPNLSKLEVRNTTKVFPLGETKSPNDFLSILKGNWYIIAGILVLGALLVYFLIFKWLFSGLLLRRRWGVGSAQNFTMSMGILIMLAIIVGLSLYYLGMRPETWIILGIMAALWLLHGVVWLVSGNRTA